MIPEDEMKEMDVTPSECAKRERPSETKIGPSVEPAAMRSDESHSEQRIGEEYGKCEPDQLDGLIREGLNGQK